MATQITKSQSIEKIAAAVRKPQTGSVLFLKPTPTA